MTAAANAPARLIVRLRRRVVVNAVRGEIVGMDLFNQIATIPPGSDVVIQVRGNVEIVCESLYFLGPRLRTFRTIELAAHGCRADLLRHELQQVIDRDEDGW